MAYFWIVIRFQPENTTEVLILLILLNFLPINQQINISEIFTQTLDFLKKILLFWKNFPLSNHYGLMLTREHKPRRNDAETTTYSKVTTEIIATADSVDEAFADTNCNS